MIRKALFWMHLACGVAAALVILMMSVTGVLLTYERQILAAFGPSVDEPAGRDRLPVAALVHAVEQGEPGFQARTVAISADPTRPVAVGAGRGNARLVDQYTAEVLGDGEGALREFFSAVTGWHRWFNAPRESRGPWRAITGASNLIFLFLIVSGLYLWLPRVYRWAMFRARLVFVPWSTAGKARDFNWHHVIGIWSALPLIVIVATAAVFYYPWANDLLYRSFGEEPPGSARAAAPASPAGEAAARAAGEQGALAGRAAQDRASAPLSSDQLFDIAAAHLAGWRTITVPAHPSDAAEARVTIDLGNGGQPQHRHTLVLDKRTGETVAWQPFDSQTAGRQARSWARFLHTGEALGLAGQTVAGLVSLTTILMVWTGLALAYRRLIAPLFRARG